MRQHWFFSVLLPVSLLAIAGCTGPGRSADEPAAERSMPEALPVALAAADANASQSKAGARGGISLSSAAQPAGDGPVVMRLALGRPMSGARIPSALLLKVDYAAAASARVDRPPLNIALVLDNSASMVESRKLLYAIDAARLVIENLTDRDSVAIVTFNDRATVLSGAGQVVNKPFLFHRLDEITPENFTNLSAGLLEGIAQINNSSVQGHVKQVFLLTDGRPNRGVTEPSALRRIVQEAKAQEIGVSTFGVGADFNESLMADMAAGGGRYTYIKTSEQIPTAFKDVLHGLLQVVAQNAVIAVSTTGGQIGRVFGQLRDEPTMSVNLTIGDLRATERGFFLAELNPAHADSAAPLQVDVRLVYDDPQTGRRISRSSSLRALPGDRFEDESVSLLAAVLDAVERADSAAQGLDIERYRQAQTSFDPLYRRAHDLALHNRDQDLLNQTFVLKHFMGELAAAEQEGLLHDHREAQEKLKKESHYLRYLLTHHRPQS